MRWNTPAFRVAVAIHLIAVLLAWLVPLIADWRAEPPQHVFELVAVAPDTAEPPTQQPVVDTAAVSRLPELPPLRSVPPPQPRPQPVPQPAPQPAPTQQPAPRLSIDEFRRTQPQRTTPNSRPPTPANRPVTVPQIDTNVGQRLQTNLSALRMTTSAPASGAVAPDLLQAWLGQLSARLQAAFQPVGSGLWAEAAFTVGGDGTVRDARIVRGSGDPAFDGAVLATFGKVTSSGPPPGGGPLSFTLRFGSE
jgi:TonB family protein